MTISGDDCAFPVVVGDDDSVSEWGLTIRDWFAAKALTGLLADSEQAGSPQDFARLAYQHADAMLSAREAKP